MIYNNIVVGFEYNEMVDPGGDGYWSSTQNDAWSAYFNWMNSWIPNNVNKNTPRLVRCVRVF